MTYADAVSFVHSRLVFGSRPGLESMKRITSLLGDPQRGMRFLHVAGTNGKGSVSTMLAAMLTAAGQKTGLYTSPYVVDFRERFQIDGRMIPKAAFAALIERLKPLVERLDGEGCVITEFELITAAAFLWFCEEKCDAVVLEVGLGGRFDATNIIEAPACSVITHIDLDHTRVLGDTYAAIAAEKAGILKPGCPAVVYPDQRPEALAVIEQTAAERGCPFTVAPLATGMNTTLAGSDFVWQGQTYHTPLLGAHQLKNAATALSAAQAIGLPAEAMRQGLAAATIAARQEVLCADPLVLLDGAHNPDGVAALAATLTAFGVERPTLILGMLADKDYARAVAALVPLCGRVITLRVPNPRTLSAAALAKALRPYCDDVRAARSYREALALAAQTDGPVVAAGSLYLAAALRPRLLSWVKERHRPTA